ncbi:hypothetical protein [Streptomyces sp. WAC00263]|uniref:hypothetical protein n=1 Tax=Streptomyces sp. WAC00263 TaxID=1917422 RepID=UPI001F50FC1D|nr:hypothetical protein [Streptomyces sp. WAC00263]
MSELRRVLQSLGKAARTADVPVIAGDTEVVGAGRGGQGLHQHHRHRALRPPAALARPGDADLVSGPIGLHRTTVLSTREGLGFESDIASGSRPLHRLIHVLARSANTSVPCATRPAADAPRP